MVEARDKVNIVQPGWLHLKRKKKKDYQCMKCIDNGII